MTDPLKDKYSAGEQGLGYIYQPRFALLRLFELSESTELLIEKDDDLDFIHETGAKALASLKHKAEGDRLTDLSTDFWKSVRIWVTRYKRDGCLEANLTFFLFTTAKVSATSFLRVFVSRPERTDADDAQTAEDALGVLAKSNSKLGAEIRTEISPLDETERRDFFSRIVIVDSAPRISDIPQKIMDVHMRSIQRRFRPAIFERLEGWWNDLTVDLLAGRRSEAVSGYELSDKLSTLAGEYTSENLPIHFAGMFPVGEIDATTDGRQFVVQLREIGVQSDRIRNAILDYYRAFEQRSVWARENVLVAGEMERFEDRLVDEWSRYRDVVFEELDEDSAHPTLLAAGRALYRWADLESGNLATLRIRERVTEPYIVRGGFHMLANARPTPRIYWHPLFLELVGKALAESK
ncbi:hypothetical protein E3O25_14380 [Cryobacterium sp. TMT1-3]|uniref:ABC-three component system protein n=1 Tax=Cryobacterium sp. TMT1-3 TaxID=1259237 RepID=UPI00106A516E|nr:ABC-three component system protein [Cryobacterium sp. TMT1-3]TFC25179.1 hypothetical protein E3O25_14380 [Cryobacterium sp. TMT1-3]